MKKQKYTKYILIAAMFMTVMPMVCRHCYAQDDSCCNGNSYDPSYQGCCNDHIYDMDESGCCNNIIYDLSTHGCCDGQIYTLGDHGCCGGQIFDRAAHGCCDGNVFDKRETKTHSDEKADYELPVPELLEAVAEFFGLHSEAKVHTTLNLWEGKACCGGSIVNYSRGTLRVDANITHTFEADKLPIVDSILHHLKKWMDADTTGVFTESVTGGPATIVQKWENCQRTVEGTVPIQVSMSADINIDVKGKHYASKLGKVKIKGNLVGRLRITHFQPIQIAADGVSGCFVYDVHIPLLPFLNATRTWGTCS